MLKSWYKIQKIINVKDTYTENNEKKEYKTKKEIWLNKETIKELQFLLQEIKLDKKQIWELVEFEEKNLEKIYKKLKEKIQNKENKETIYFVNIFPLIFINSYKIWDILDKFEEIKDNIVIEIIENWIWLWNDFSFTYYDKFLISVLKNYKNINFSIDNVKIQQIKDYNNIHFLTKLEKILNEEKITNLKYIKLDKNFISHFNQIKSDKDKKMVVDEIVWFINKNKDIKIIFKNIEKKEDENIIKSHLINLNNKNIFFQGYKYDIWQNL